jgi:hypothetical protein
MMDFMTCLCCLNDFGLFSKRTSSLNSQFLDFSSPSHRGLGSNLIGQHQRRMKKEAFERNSEPNRVSATHFQMLGLDARDFADFLAFGLPSQNRLHPLVFNLDAFSLGP